MLQVTFINSFELSKHRSDRTKHVGIFCFVVVVVHIVKCEVGTTRTEFRVDLCLRQIEQVWCKLTKLPPFQSTQKRQQCLLANLQICQQNRVIHFSVITKNWMYDIDKTTKNENHKKFKICEVTPLVNVKNSIKNLPYLRDLSKFPIFLKMWPLYGDFRKKSVFHKKIGVCWRTYKYTSRISSRIVPAGFTFFFSMSDGQITNHNASEVWDLSFFL